MFLLKVTRHIHKNSNTYVKTTYDSNYIIFLQEHFQVRNACFEYMVNIKSFEKKLAINVYT